LFGYLGRETVWHGTDSVGATSAARCLVLHNLPPGFFCLTSIMLSYIHMLDAYEDSKTWLCQQQQRSRNKAKHAFSRVMSWVVPQGKPKQHTSWGEAYPVQTATRKILYTSKALTIRFIREPSCEICTQRSESLSNAPGPGAPILLHRVRQGPTLHLIKRLLRGAKAALACASPAYRNGDMQISGGTHTYLRSTATQKIKENDDVKLPHRNKSSDWSTVIELTNGNG
jgi:hypothetical protein